MNFLSFDIGTTCCKCQLFSENGEILEYLSEEHGFYSEEGEKYVDIEAITRNVLAMIGKVAERHRVDSVSFSSIGESFVLLDKEGNILIKPMLYTDRRGGEEAAEISARFGDDFIFRTTGAAPHAMYSVSKLLWIKKHRPEVYARADKLLLIEDYLGYLLTGKRVIDYSLASRTGVFDIVEKRFSAELCGALGIDVRLFSEPKRAGTVVGEVILRGLGGCTLVLGSHDQVCAALGAGILEAGQAVDGMGTVECITAVYSGAKHDAGMREQGYCCVPYAIDGLYCSYIVNYAGGSIVNWFKNKILHGYKGGEESAYAYLEKGMGEGPTGLYVLPYFAGAAIPYNDVSAKGAIVGLTTATTDSEIYQTIMEALSMEMKLETKLAEAYGICVKSAVATGGCANSAKWLQIKADVQNIPYATLRSSEGGLCGGAILQAVAMKGESFASAAETFVQIKGRYSPDRPERYAEKYEKYVGIYNKIKELF